jgi:hypothetical protein
LLLRRIIVAEKDLPLQVPSFISQQADPLVAQFLGFGNLKQQGVLISSFLGQDRYSSLFLSRKQLGTLDKER